MALKWGIVGCGVAGKARARALAVDPRAMLVCGLRGDVAATGAEAVDSLEALLERVDAVAVCSPDHTHPRIVQAALEAHKHVICEFPLAGSAGRARALYALADEVDRVLHVEHIELLTQQARWLRAHASPRALNGGAITFRSRIRPEAFSIAHGNVARLHRVVDAVGMPSRFQLHHASIYELEGRLHFDSGAQMEFTFHMEDGAKRVLELTLVLAHGTVVQIGRWMMFKGAPVTLPEGPGLFATDQLAASAAILDGTPAYVDRERVLAVLELADQLHARAQQLIDNAPR